jgi:hypothetical protein
MLVRSLARIAISDLICVEAWYHQAYCQPINLIHLVLLLHESLIRRHVDVW